LHPPARPRFPTIQMQTNGIPIADGKPVTEKHLDDWYRLGLTTIAVSVVHYEAAKNKAIYVPYREYIDLPALVKKLHDKGFSVRLTTILVKGYIDSAAELEKLVEFARTHKIEQVTATPITKPDKSESKKILDWTTLNALTGEQFTEVKGWVEKNGTPVLDLAHGARVFDINGQNLCLR